MTAPARRSADRRRWPSSACGGWEAAVERCGRVVREHCGAHRASSWHTWRRRLHELTRGTQQTGWSSRPQPCCPERWPGQTQRPVGDMGAQRRAYDSLVSDWRRGVFCATHAQQPVAHTCLPATTAPATAAEPRFTRYHTHMPTDATGCERGAARRVPLCRSPWPGTPRCPWPSARRPEPLPPRSGWRPPPRAPCARRPSSSCSSFPYEAWLRWLVTVGGLCGGYVLAVVIRQHQPIVPASLGA